MVGRGNVYMDFVDEENRGKARRDYERALHINPHFLAARCNLAYSLQVSWGRELGKGWRGGCIKKMHINPHFLAARCNLAYSLEVRWG